MSCCQWECFAGFASDSCFAVVVAASVVVASSVAGELAELVDYSALSVLAVMASD
jgi:hypothetical protein